jgi:signal transduction histidine kinase
MLAVLASLTYAHFFQAPYSGFEFEIDDGKVSLVYDPIPTNPSLQIGDQIVQINQVNFESFESNLRQRFFKGVKPGQAVPFQVIRDGQLLNLTFVLPGPTPSQILARLNSTWWMSYVFWLAGTATLFFIRPKDTRWKLFIAFNYLTATGLAAGGFLSHWHIGQSAYILRSAVWLALPVYLHFHWNFPSPLATAPNFIWWLIYMAGGLAAIGEWCKVINPNLFFAGFFCAVIGSGIILFLQLIFQHDSHADIMILLIGIFLILFPPTSLSFLVWQGYPLSNLQQAIFLLTLPSLPGIYFFLIYRSQFRGLERLAKRSIIIYLLTIFAAFGIILFYSLLFTHSEVLKAGFGLSIFAILLGGLLATISLFPFIVLPAVTGAVYETEVYPGKLTIRPNRLVSSYLFFILAATLLSLLIITAQQNFNFSGDSIVIAMLAALLGGVISWFGYRPFQRLVESRLLNIPLPPTDLLETYASRITTSLKRDSLISLLRDEILPTLLVRQSALLWLDNDQKNTPLLVCGVSTDQLPNNGDIDNLLHLADGYHHPRPTNRLFQPFTWVRLALPIKLDEKLTGIWLFGKRDPDDFYPPSEVPILQALANQTAIALTNIHQSEQLRNLYQANITRQEIERKQLALFLHDEVLNELAALGMQTDRRDFSKRFLATQQSLNTSIRQIISGLRPMMLNYGIGPAMEELVESLIETNSPAITFELDLHPKETRYNPDCESHLYWMVRQACENAVQHARATRVCVYGQLNPEHLILTIEDDGVGFDVGDQRDLLSLFDAQHYGLVGMYERATILGAELSLQSKPGQGSKTTIHWKPKQE